MAVLTESPSSDCPIPSIQHTPEIDVEAQFFRTSEECPDASDYSLTYAAFLEQRSSQAPEQYTAPADVYTPDNYITQKTIELCKLLQEKEALGGLDLTERTALNALKAMSAQSLPNNDSEQAA